MNATSRTPADGESARPSPPPFSVNLLDNWRNELAGWAISEEITSAAAQSPWALPRQVFARRADRLAAAPEGPSWRRAWGALDPPGSVLDVGAGAGAACVPLLARTTALTAVDTDPEMLALLAERAGALAGTVTLVTGSWPAVAPEAAPADLVTCFNVVYNAPGILPFLAALTARARRLVVVELTAEHPLAWPERPVAAVPRSAAAVRADGRRPAADPGRDGDLGRPRAVAAARRGRLRQLRGASRSHHPPPGPAAGADR